ADAVTVSDEVVRQRLEQLRMRRLTVELREVERFDRLDQAEAEHFLPDVVDGRARELAIGGEHPREGRPVRLAGSRLLAGHEEGRRHAILTGDRQTRGLVAVV